ncbi:MAG: uroporphyrinogen-III synthase [Myxococcota bacterium]|nr:uroporphyrinogen-III synthase [Myxococcota bacterium]
MAHVNQPLLGVRVGLLEARMESELASLVRRHGGLPVCAPALRELERVCPEEVTRACESASRGAAVIVLTTGVGVARWLRMADELGRGLQLRADFGRSTVVCRGPKPVAVLKREGLPVHVRAESPHTTAELLVALAAIDVAGRDVILVHDGGAHREVVDAQSARGAHVVELQPYAWALPEDVAPLRSLIESIVAGDIEALALTTQVQARHLFQVAESMGSRPALLAALRNVVVAAVGPTCAAVLTELGAPPQVVPDPPKMGAMILALAERFAREPRG